jgi:hypothetical protein
MGEERNAGKNHEDRKILQHNLDKHHFDGRRSLFYVFERIQQSIRIRRNAEEVGGATGHRQTRVERTLGDTSRQRTTAHNGICNGHYEEAIDPVYVLRTGKFLTQFLLRYCFPGSNNSSRRST